ncbi:MAG TPA: GIY-YIG nuclease family protein [Devosiaceae bacterium]|nr:GIY-YIG nuclease family protein [Devosiaceae bacterium]
MNRTYFVYLLASGRNDTLYVGVTNDLVRRVGEHREGTAEGFTRKYHVHHLIWFAAHEDIEQAILREKQIKRWKREWKVALFRDTNPRWEDLYPGLLTGWG